MHETGIPKLYSKRRKEGFFKVDPELWSRFKADCAGRGVSVCYVLETLMEGWLQAQKVNATIIQPVNMTINMQHVVERPRRISRFPEEGLAENVAEYIAKYGSCRRLEPRGLYPGRIGWCSWLKRWIMGFECSTCIHSGEAPRRF